jgi:hypothetical protein
MAVAAVVPSTRTAWANAAAGLAFDNEGGAFIERGTVVAVQHEEIDFRCDVDGCEFRATYHLQNPSDARAEVLGAFYGIAAQRLTATADGVDVRHALTAQQAKDLDDIVAALDKPVVKERTTLRQGFLIAVEPHASAVLVFTGRMRPAFWDVHATTDVVRAATEARHPWLGTRKRSDLANTYVYALSPIRSWAGSPDIDITVRCPRSLWAPYQHEEGWSLADESTDVVARRTIQAQNASTLRFTLIAEHGTVALNGGPFVAAGGQLSPGDFRLRVGYEAAVPDWLVWSASVEANVHGQVTFVPLAEAASPELFLLIPSFALGAGVPVRVEAGGRTLAGIRGQLTMSYPVFSLVLPIDVFPTDAAGDGVQVSLYGQASF